MNTLKSTVSSLYMILTIPLIGLIYPVLNNPSMGVHCLVTDLDRSIPFEKIFILPYIGWGLLVFIILIYLGLNDKETYRKTLIAVNISLVLCFGVYFFYQTYVPRPELVGSDFLTHLVRLVYAYDAPFNTFPSIHCLTSYLMIQGIRGSAVKNFLNTVIISSCAFTVILSTQFVKQHVLLDAVAAILLGEMVWRAVGKLNEAVLKTYGQPLQKEVT